MIAAFLAGAAPDEAVALPAALSEDLAATLRCLKALSSEQPRCDCGESGSTARFLLPVAAALGKNAAFTGAGRLPLRPMDELVDAMSAHGVNFSSRRLPLELSGQLKPGCCELSGALSSQYLTGLLFALPLLKSASSIRLTAPLVSSGYVALTLEVLRQFGIRIEKNRDEFVVPAPQDYRLPETPLSPEGDWSNAAFLLTAGALAGDGITVIGLNPDSAQGDKAVTSWLQVMGAEVHPNANGCTIRPAPLKGAVIDVSQIPDLVPVLAVAASVAEGTTRFVNAGRLRLKESDRLTMTAALIRSLGGNAAVEGDCLAVTGVPQLSGGEVDAAGDHRLAMAAAVAAVRSAAPVVIRGAECVRKSWPDFFEQLRH